jgi:hypothetical protein
MMPTEINTLFAGPWVGEFGWELFCWQGMLRSFVKKRGINKVIIGCRTGHEYLYKDFADDFVNVDPTAVTDCQRCTSYTYNDLHKQYTDGVGDRWVNPFLQYDKLIRCTNGSQMPFLPNCEYIKYGDPTVVPKSYDVLIHARGTDKYGTDFRNWPEFKWNDLVKYTGLSFASIGSEQGAYHIDNTDDLRGVSLEQLCGYMSASTMVLGPSSGPMHLASLCGTPHFVWSGDRPNVERYEKYWNPLKTKVKILDHVHGWDPPLLTILKEMEKFYASCCNSV